jgi:2-polyprenyl-3-methyl-5-hydroxy-6-metoxy-1,4-benzoquinol methylase
VEALSQVDKLEIAARKREIEARYGPWTAHNLQLWDDLYTIRPGVAGGNEARVRQVLQLVADLAHGPIERLRILDLGALEGLFAVELARQGASVVAVEGREANLEKMRLAKEALGLEHLELRQEDVRALDRARHGEFDVVLCLGLLYHLDASDIFSLLERMHEVCRDLVIIETRISSYQVPNISTTVDGTGASSPLNPLPTPLHTPEMPCGRRSATLTASNSPARPCATPSPMWATPRCFSATCLLIWRSERFGQPSPPSPGRVCPSFPSQS